MLGDFHSPMLFNTMPEVVGGMSESVSPLFISSKLSEIDGNVIVTCLNNNKAKEMFHQLEYLGSESSKSFIFLPELEVLPYDQEAPIDKFTSERINSLHKIAKSKGSSNLVIVSTPRAISQFIMSLDYWADIGFELNLGMSISISEILSILDLYGYKETQTEVASSGLYVAINQIVDVFLSTEQLPVRIVLSDGVISKINYFDPDTQVTIPDAKDISLTLLPVREVVLTPKFIETFRIKFRELLSASISDNTYRSVSKGIIPNGIEFFVSLFGDSTSIISEFSSNNDCIFMMENVDSSLESFNNFCFSRYEEQTQIYDRNLLTPDEVWLSAKEINACLSKVNLTQISGSHSEGYSLYNASEIEFEKSYDLGKILASLKPYVGKSEKIIFALRNKSKKQQVARICMMLGLGCDFAASLKDVFASNSKGFFSYLSVSKSIYDTELKLLILTEKDIFSSSLTVEENSKGTSSFDNEQKFLSGLKVNDLVIHRHFGIARFKGLVKAVNYSNVPEQYCLEFAKGVLYQDFVENLDLIEVYDNINKDNVKLSVYNKDTDSPWNKSLYSSLVKIQSSAASLIDSMMHKEFKTGITIPEPDFNYVKFCKEFEFEPTQDQLRATEDILSDLTSSKPMDRIVAGDVGFGKTEVALRASMICACSKYQVVITVPSVLLASQHFKSFQDRFRGFDVNVCELTSNTTSSEFKDRLEGIKNGFYDIVIGTHKALNKNIIFKNLGLVVIDEEHKFGVAHKESIRERYSDINILSMTATPIPRTLQMSLRGVRDTSILSTPPAAKIPVITRVEERNKYVINEAVQREVLRDGQVFYVHNRKDTIIRKKQELQEQFPNLRIECVHGDLDTSSMEKIMSDFAIGCYDILLATTVIEIGINVVNANTIIIERSDTFGLASLHQLRGRIGRGDRQGYCYLLIETNLNVSEEGQKRLSAMVEASNLGDGYKLAYHDLQIRGAGEILGTEQSGEMDKLGYEIYEQMLRSCISFMRDNGEFSITEAQQRILLRGRQRVNINMSGCFEILASYLPSQSSRVYYYRSLLLAETVLMIDAIRDEMVNRFGVFPDSMEALFVNAKLRILSNKRALVGITIDKNRSFITFSRHDVDFSVIMDIYSKDPDFLDISVDDGGCSTIVISRDTDKIKADGYKYLLDLLA